MRSTTGTPRSRLDLGAVVATIRTCQGLRDKSRHKGRKRGMCLQLHIDSQAESLFAQDIQLRLSSLPHPRGAPSTRLNLAHSPDASELVLQQLVSVRNLVNQSLDIVDVSAWTGNPLDAGFIFSQLHLLHETISEARQMLKGDGDEVRGKWWEASAAENVWQFPHFCMARICSCVAFPQLFDPPLPPYLSFHLSIADSALVLILRTLEPNTPTQTPTAFASDISLTGLSLRDRIFGSRQRAHDEVGDVFSWNGEDVYVKEKVRVESQDPSLMAVMAKLSALEHEVMRWVAALRVLMGNEETESEA